MSKNPPFLNMVDVPDDAMDVICTNAERYPGIEDYLDSKESFFDPATNYVYIVLILNLQIIFLKSLRNIIKRNKIKSNISCFCFNIGGLLGIRT